jgi:hypothetical protein
MHTVCSYTLFVFVIKDQIFEDLFMCQLYKIWMGKQFWNLLEAH